MIVLLTACWRGFNLGGYAMWEWLAVVAGNPMKVEESLFSGSHLSNMS